MSSPHTIQFHRLLPTLFAESFFIVLDSIFDPCSFFLILFLSFPIVFALGQLNFLFLGISQILWVPIAVKWGKRPAMIASMLLLFVAQIWAAKAGSFESLLAARCVIGLASGAGEVRERAPARPRDKWWLILAFDWCRASFPPSSRISSFCTNARP